MNRDSRALLVDIVWGPAWTSLAAVAFYFIVTWMADNGS